MAQIVTESASQQAAEQQAKGIAGEIEALDKKAEQLPRAQFLTDVSELQEKLGGLGISEAAKVAGLEKLSSLLDDLLAAELGAASEEAAGGATEATEVQASKRTKRARALLEVVGAAESLSLAYEDLPAADRASALLIAKAAVQQRFDAANLGAKRSRDLLVLHRHKLDARVTQLSRLSEAALALGNVGGNSSIGAIGLRSRDRTWFTRALVQYGAATSRGDMIYERLDRREAQLDLAYRVDLGERTAANRRALIAPAVAQIEAAGKAGIKPELLTNLAGQLGITASILGK